MLIIYFLFTERTVVSAAGDTTVLETTTRLNTVGPESNLKTSPELEKKITEGIDAAGRRFDREWKDSMSLIDFTYTDTTDRGKTKEFNCYVGELKRMKTITREGEGDASLTFIDEHTRRISFFVRLRSLEITYYHCNQTNFEDIFQKGMMTIIPESNSIRIDCIATVSYTHLDVYKSQQ